MLKKITIFIAIGIIGLLLLWKATLLIGQRQDKETVQQLENTIKKTVMTCYANEGVYPPTIEYMKENYGLQIDEEKFKIFYEIEGSNLMPQITIIEID